MKKQMWIYEWYTSRIKGLSWPDIDSYWYDFLKERKTIYYAATNHFYRAS